MVAKIKQEVDKKELVRVGAEKMVIVVPVVRRKGPAAWRYSCVVQSYG